MFRTEHVSVRGRSRFARVLRGMKSRTTRWTRLNGWSAA